MTRLCAECVSRSFFLSGDIWIDIHEVSTTRDMSLGRRKHEPRRGKGRARRGYPSKQRRIGWQKQREQRVDGGKRSQDCMIESGVWCAVCKADGKGGWNARDQAGKKGVRLVVVAGSSARKESRMRARAETVRTQRGILDGIYKNVLDGERMAGFEREATRDGQRWTGNADRWRRGENAESGFMGTVPDVDLTAKSVCGSRPERGPLFMICPLPAASLMSLMSRESCPQCPFQSSSLLDRRKAYCAAEDRCGRGADTIYGSDDLDSQRGKGARESPGQLPPPRPTPHHPAAGPHEKAVPEPLRARL